MSEITLMGCFCRGKAELSHVAPRKWMVSCLACGTRIWSCGRGSVIEKWNACVSSMKPHALLGETERLTKERDQWRSVAQSQTPGGSEFTTPQSVKEFCDNLRSQHIDTVASFKRRAEAAEARVKELEEQRYNAAGLYGPYRPISLSGATIPSTEREG